MCIRDRVSTEALLGNSEITVTVDLTQKQADWQSLDLSLIHIFQRLSRQLQKIRPIQMGLACENITALVHFPEPGYGHGETECLALFACTYIQAVIHLSLIHI